MIYYRTEIIAALNSFKLITSETKKCLNDLQPKSQSQIN